MNVGIWAKAKGAMFSSMIIPSRIENIIFLRILDAYLSLPCNGTMILRCLDQLIMWLHIFQPKNGGLFGCHWTMLRLCYIMMKCTITQHGPREIPSRIKVLQHQFNKSHLQFLCKVVLSKRYWKQALKLICIITKMSQGVEENKDL